MSIMFTITLNNFSKCQLKLFFVSEFPLKGFVCTQIEEKNMHGYWFLISYLYRFYFNLLTFLWRVSYVQFDRYAGNCCYRAGCLSNWMITSMHQTFHCHYNEKDAKM